MLSPTSFTQPDTFTTSIMRQYKTGVALLFSGIFHLLALVLMFFSISTFMQGLFDPSGDMVSLVINVINTLIIALADRKSTRLNSSHVRISYAVFCLKKKKKILV